MKSKYAETEEAESSGGLPVGPLRQRTTGEAEEREAIEDQIQALREELECRESPVQNPPSGILA